MVICWWSIYKLNYNLKKFLLNYHFILLPNTQALTTLISFPDHDFSLFLSHLQDIKCILFFKLHKGSSKLNSLLKVLKDLLLNLLHFHIILSSTAPAWALLILFNISRITNILIPHEIISQRLVVLQLLLIVVYTMIIQLQLEIINLLSQIIDNILVFSNMNRVYAA